MGGAIAYIVAAGPGAPDTLGFIADHPAACVVIAALVVAGFWAMESKAVPGGAKLLVVPAAFVLAFVVWRAARDTDLAADITVNPALLCDTRVTARDVTCRGIRLGDTWETFGQRINTEVKVAEHGRGSREAYGPEGFVWGFQGDRLAAVILHDKKVLAGLGLQSRADIEARFGKADRVDEISSPKGFFGSEAYDWTYYYDTRGFSVEWLADGGLNRIQLGTGQ